MLFVNTNVSALKGMDFMSNVTDRLNRSFEQLSSGSRINSARDDAAGLQISNRLETQIIGTNQATRNIQDGLSALQIADGAMGEITNITHRVRQLAIQMSSNTLSQEDRDGAQLEVEELIRSANQIAESASLGGKTPLLQGPTVDEDPSTPLSDQDILLQLNGALEQSEANIKAYFGLEGDGVDEFTVNVGAAGGAVASVSFGVGTNNVTALNIDRAAFQAGWSGDTTQNDRVIMHEMVHAVMVNQLSTGFQSSDWFVEGAAELIHGADERVLADLGATAPDTFMAAFSNSSAASADYSRGYIATRMLHDEMKTLGHADGIATFMQYLKPEGRTVSDALEHFLGMTEAEYITHVQNTGGSYITNNMNLTNSDVGAIGGLDADGMGIKDAHDSVGDSKSYSEQPLEGFKIDWSAVSFTPPHKKTFQLQTGSQSGEQSGFSIRGGTAERIGLAGINVSANARGSIEVADKALKNIHEIRREIAGTMAELESMQRNNTGMVVNTSDAKSRIQDTDFAAATADLTRNQIIQQASSTILAQANQTPNIALSLLR
ncbi:flagellinolysin [Oceanospirillum sanctuarii]|uniref:flagellinolysin n=1 Tax=Oceanospirillum sanctuarii TaxID=1434821 RepID=UPI000A3BBD7C|nr:flagellinolysin [Oceanospirillum sanctuarii]